MSVTYLPVRPARYTRTHRRIPKERTSRLSTTASWSTWQPETRPDFYTAGGLPQPSCPMRHETHSCSSVPCLRKQTNASETATVATVTGHQGMYLAAPPATVMIYGRFMGGHYCCSLFARCTLIACYLPQFTIPIFSFTLQRHSKLLRYEILLKTGGCTTRTKKLHSSWALVAKAQ